MHEPSSDLIQFFKVLYAHKFRHFISPKREMGRIERSWDLGLRKHLVRKQTLKNTSVQGQCVLDYSFEVSYIVKSKISVTDARQEG